MKYVLLSVLLLISVSVLTPSVFAEIEKGVNYDRELLQINPDGSALYKWTSTPERIINYYDDGKPVYVNYLTSEDSSKIYFESKHNTIIFDKTSNTLEIYPGGKLINSQVEMKLSHSIKEAINGTDVWNDILVNEIPQTTKTINEKGIQIISSRGDFKTIYDIGLTGFEYTYEYTNNDITKSDYKYGFTSVCDGIDCNVILIDGVTVNIGETKGKSEIINSIIKVGNRNLDLKNKQHDYTWALNHPNQDKLIIDFTHSKGRLNIGDTLIVDPSFSSSASPNDGRLIDTGNNDVCDGDTLSEETTNWISATRSKSSRADSDCIRGWVEWDITSIPDDSNVTNTLFLFDVGALESGSGLNCDYVSLQNAPSSRTPSQTWNDISSGVDMLTNDSTCTTTGSNKSVDLGSTGDSQVESKLASDYFAIGFLLNDEVLDNVDSYGTHIYDTQTAGTPDPTLEITYTTIPSPDAVDDLTLDSVSQTTAQISWTLPGLNGESFINYMLNFTTPQESPVTVFNQNTTDTTINLTGLTLGTSYSAQVSVFTAGGGNWTIPDSLVLNFTTSTWSPPGAPTLGANALSDTSIRYQSSAGISGDNSTIWFSLQCELNWAGGWFSTVSNSSLPGSRSYDVIGLILGDVNICQWRDGSVDGWSGWSNNATDILQLLVLQSARSDTSDDLKSFEKFIDDMGGFYFGLGLFPFITMMLGFMAGKKTVRIFTLITLFMMGIIHASGFFVYPDWYWGISMLLGLVLVLGRQRSD